MNLRPTLLVALLAAAACAKGPPPVDATPAASATPAVTEAPVASAAPATSAAPTASAAPVASAAPSASATQIAVPSSYPPLDTTCATDDDCTSTGMWGDCCGACEQKYANKAYVPRVQAYCAAHPAPQCPPMGCSWGMSKPQCRAGHCQAWKK